MESKEAINLLKALISTPSLSRNEDDAAAVVRNHLREKGILFDTQHNNTWAKNLHFDNTKPTILLNSHIDTVKPNSSYTLDPFKPIEKDGKLYGLGSNDAGGSVVSLIATFAHFYHCDNLTHNLLLAITGEEECSGTNGIECLLPLLPTISAAIVGEPTMMQMAIAERGLMVIDCVSHGKAGHAAREEGDNAIFHAIKDIQWFSDYVFPKKSELFGAVKMSVTIISSGSQHNVVPDECRFTVDVRTTEKYTNQEVLDIIKSNVKSDVTARSTRLTPSQIEISHPLVQSGLKLGLTTYGSPTTSDSALLGDIPTLKIGAGDSARSHTADEFIYLDEIDKAIIIYKNLLTQVITDNTNTSVI